MYQFSPDQSTCRVIEFPFVYWNFVNISGLIGSSAIPLDMHTIDISPEIIIIIYSKIPCIISNDDDDRGAIPFYLEILIPMASFPPRIARNGGRNIQPSHKK